VRLLVEAGANVNEKDKDGNTLLRLATKAGDTELAQFLIDHGADIRLSKTNEDLFKAFGNNGVDLAAIKQCIEAGVDINAVEKGSSASTALHKAAYAGSLETVKYLVAQGAKMDIVDSNGRMPLTIARDYNRPAKAEIIAFLEIAERALGPEWVLFGSSSVAHVEGSIDLARKLTQIFNFESRERRVFSENLKTSAETESVTRFEELDQETVKKALEQFKNLGGEADEEYVLRGGSRLNKGQQPGL